jgi:putative transcriptional regulator
MDLRNQFLLAMPTLADPNFQRTLTYICDHSEHGAMGLVVNRPMAITVGEVLNHLDISPEPGAALQTPVHYGGPVESERGFLLHSPTGHWDGSIPLTEDLALTTSRDILEAIARNEGPARALMMLGYSGWAPGQLEQEVADNAWLSGPAASDILFDTPAEERLGAAAARMGIDLSRLSADAGHA